MSTDYLGPLWELLAKEAPNTDVQKTGQDIAKKLDQQLADISRQRKILDEILGWKAPVVQAWQDLNRVTVGDPFRESIRGILKELVLQGKKTVDIDQIHGIVIQRGISSGNRKNVKTSIGNYIFQTPGWSKKTKGIYEFKQTQE
ncbi:MAG: hypothetical protein HYX92_10220 [Chloroflexi bacterium]|nr:hypothetical protein [Chloroflexota bacterium]